MAKSSEKNCILDLIKAVLCLLIVGSHCIPLFRNLELNYYYGQWFFRFSVPFFFISSGFFFAKMDKEKKNGYIRRLIIIYVISTIIYTPFLRGSLLQTIRSIVFGYGHLWYLSALILGLVVLCVADKLLRHRKYYLILFIWGGGVLLNTYYRFFDVKLVNELSTFMIQIGGTRHFLFFAVPMLLIGDYISSKEDTIYGYSRSAYFGLFLLFFFLGFAEAQFLKEHFGADIKIDLSIFGWMPSIPLFILGIVDNTQLSKDVLRMIRKAADIVYIIHPLVIALVSKLFKVVLLSRYMLVSVVSILISLAILLAKQQFKGRKTSHHAKKHS